MAKDRDGGSQAQFDALCKGSQDHAVHLCGVCALCLCGQFDKDDGPSLFLAGFQICARARAEPQKGQEVDFGQTPLKADYYSM